MRKSRNGTGWPRRIRPPGLDGRLASGSPESGFTLLETLVAISILAALGLVIGAAGSVALNRLPRIHQYAGENAELLRFDDALRAAAERVTVPFWLPGPLLEIEGAAARAPWLDGDRERLLHLSGEGGRILLRAGDETANVFALELAGLRSWQDSAGRCIGLSVSLRLDGKEPELRARFGGSGMETAP